MSHDLITFLSFCVGSIRFLTGIYFPESNLKRFICYCFQVLFVQIPVVLVLAAVFALTNGQGFGNGWEMHS